MNSFKAVCFICFDSEQKLQALTEKWSLDSIQNLIGHQLIPLEMENILICINCKSLLRKYNKFQNQIKYSYNLLKNCYYQMPEITQSELFKLKTKEQFNIIINPDGTWQDFLETNIKNEPDIKNYISADTDNDIYIPQIATPKKKKKKRTATYKEIELNEMEAEKEREILACQDEFKNATLKCCMCIITFANQADLDEHVEKKHDESLRFKCNICNCRFAHEIRFQYHKNRHIKRYECRVCSHRFKTLNAVNKHYFINHDDRSKAIPNSVEISNEKTDLDLDIFKCDLCPKKFKYRSSLRKHTDSHMIASGQKRKPTCEPCGLTFTNKANLQKHMKSSSKHKIQLVLKKTGSQAGPEIDGVKISIQNSNMHQCEHCDKSFQWKGNLSRHLKSHIAKANGDLSCVPCGKVFSSIATYQQHMKFSRKHITESDIKYMCSDCGSKFVSKTKLTDHINWEHLKKYQHVCTECKKIFKSHTSLYVHTQFVHKKSMEYLCDLCGKSFPMKSKLAGHIQAIHHRSPHSCEQCGANFAWSSCLSRHTTHVHKRNV